MPHPLVKAIMVGIFLPFLILSNPVRSNSLGELGEYVSLGQDGAWFGEYRGGGYWVENQDDAGAIRYYYGPYDAGDDGKRTISVDITLENATADARAGILYGFNQGDRSYFLIVVGIEGVIDLYRRDQNGFNRMMQSSIDTTRDGHYRLQVRERGPEITISANGNTVGSIQSNGTGQGASGIAAIGIGRFGFSDFKESTARPTAATRPSGAVAPTSDAWSARKINDEFGFEQPMTAYTLQLPNDWTLNGAVQWTGDSSCQLDANKVHFMATSRDGSKRIEFIPGGTWGWSTAHEFMPQLVQQGYAGCPARPILDVESFLNAYLPTIRPEAQVLGTRMRPDLVAEAWQAAGDVPNDPSMHKRLEIMEAEIRYQAEGKTVNELLITSVLFGSIPGLDAYGGMNGQATTAQALGTITMATVDGQIDRKLLKQIGDSVAMTPEYEARMKQYLDRKAEMMAAALQRRRAAQQQWLASRRAMAAANRSTSVSTVGSEILDIQHKGFQNREQIKDAGQSALVDSIHDRQAFSNTGGQIVYLPTSHKRLYQLPNDVYVGTNDAFFNPVEATGQFGQQLQPHRY
jgi:hypothetical protein